MQLLINYKIKVIGTDMWIYENFPRIFYSLYEIQKNGLYEIYIIKLIYDCWLIVSW